MMGKTKYKIFGGDYKHRQIESEEQVDEKRD